MFTERGKRKGKERVSVIEWPGEREMNISKFGCEISNLHNRYCAYVQYNIYIKMNGLI